MESDFKQLLRQLMVRRGLNAVMETIVDELYGMADLTEEDDYLLSEKFRIAAATLATATFEVDEILEDC